MRVGLRTDVASKVEAERAAWEFVKQNKVSSKMEDH